MKHQAPVGLGIPTIPIPPPTISHARVEAKKINDRYYDLLGSATNPEVEKQLLADQAEELKKINILPLPPLDPAPANPPRPFVPPLTRSVMSEQVLAEPSGLYRSRPVDTRPQYASETTKIRKRQDY